MENTNGTQGQNYATDEEAAIASRPQALSGELLDQLIHKLHQVDALLLTKGYTLKDMLRKHTHLATPPSEAMIMAEPDKWVPEMSTHLQEIVKKFVEGTL